MVGDVLCASKFFINASIDACDCVDAVRPSARTFVRRIARESARRDDDMTPHARAEVSRAIAIAPRGLARRYHRLDLYALRIITMRDVRPISTPPRNPRSYISTECAIMESSPRTHHSARASLARDSRAL